ncbi:hypothetical protein [Acidipila rosea]|uniref:Uncharacterized protein n=1 Tax=Acidipila rosea TaxID=768535 RepID=A0A4R1L1W5_9BACT|nr:hypothetical protein [Acidipila rosea]TCK70873.1 hypothetical protein C7378_3263 [Acidipila rosea]
MTAAVDLSFPHTWTATLLERRPLIPPSRQFVYPRQAEEVERGALEVLVKPAQGDTFLATCALGFADPSAPTGVWSCPDKDAMCAVAGGYAYIVDTLNPAKFVQVEYRPVLAVQALPEHGLLLLAGHHSLLAYNAEGFAWQSVRLSSEGVQLGEVEGDRLHGAGWDLITDRDVPFTIDLRSGERLS